MIEISIRSRRIVFSAIFLLAFLLASCTTIQDSPNQQTSTIAYPNQFEYPTPVSIDEQMKAIYAIREQLELPVLPLEFVQMGTMINGPDGGIGVAIYKDSEGRIYSVYPETNQVIEIDARSINISPDMPSLSPDEIKTKMMSFARSVIPDLDSIQSSLQYEEGEKVDNYFFTWSDKTNPGSLMPRFMQFGIHKSGFLFAYYNTLSLEK